MEVRKLAAPDRPREFYLYEVQGSGVLPLDMLRYDSAWPANSEAVSSMSPPRGHAEERRTIRLASYRPPTDGRWRSFGWVVVE